MASKPKPTPAEKLIKSKDRVRDLAEVFTAKREVDAMCDLIPTISQPHARLLEPSCGNGNFLAVILERRLTALDAKVFRRRSPLNPAAKPRKLTTARQIPLEIGILQVVSNLYGVDISPDNVSECKNRLLTHVQEFYQRNNRHTWQPNPVLWPAVKHILDHNIIHGNTLLQTPTCPKDQRIHLSNWVFTGTTAPLDSPAARFCQQVFNFADLYQQPAKPISESPFLPWTSLTLPRDSSSSGLPPQSAACADLSDLPLFKGNP